ncbi:LOW QUALITY PROTEIN: raftlin-like [Rhincodon typus]|uniref:LOW QUALITY PROTEIN: raftlin-like n=1 Tax=Rhincodon typus TaxID=259920 RepID=UPI0020303C2D|nr:LOW QUALITY PROTEIN: raftlin-like [Rhincodon typus]
MDVRDAFLAASAKMGCGLPKLEKSNENSPGKIYSTLKRPQVETKVGIAYQYKVLDFTTAETEITESSAVKLSSLRHLPTQLHEFYQKGFVLAGIHPFIHCIDVRKGTPEETMFRAILIKPAASSDENNTKTEPSRLEVELSLLSNQLPKSKGLTDILQKVQEESRKGLRFVGLVQQQNSPADPAENYEGNLTVNNTLCQNNSTKGEKNACQNTPNNTTGEKLEQNQETEATEGKAKQNVNQGEASLDEGQSASDQAKNNEQISGQSMAELTNQECQNDAGEIKNKNTADCESESKVADKPEDPAQAETFETNTAEGLQSKSPPGQEQSPIATDKCNEVKHGTESCEAAEATNLSEGNDTKQQEHLRLAKPEESGKKNVENEVFLLFNKQESQKSYKYYTVTIPLKICKKGQDINSIEANWLEHMTQHFTKGALLVDALICLGTLADSVPKSVDGLFIFEGVSEDKCESYDAIVVEQWTVINGVEVKTDYVPLLNSLAAYGWQLTCVLPTPIIKRDSEGNLATKQIVFLQRPSLPNKEKKKESKKKSIKDDKSSKQEKNCLQDKNAKVTVQVKNSTGDSDENEKQEQSVASNGDKESAENGISLRTDGSEKECAPEAEAAQDTVCATNAETEKCLETVGNIGVAENIVKEASGNNDIVDRKDEQEACEDKCQNSKISVCEEEANQAKIDAKVSSKCVDTSQQLGNMPAAEVATKNTEETGMSNAEKTNKATEEHENVILVQEDDGTVTE